MQRHRPPVSPMDTSQPVTHWLWARSLISYMQIIPFGMTLMLLPPGSWTFKVNQCWLCFSLKMLCCKLWKFSSWLKGEVQLSVSLTGLRWRLGSRRFTGRCVFCSLSSEKRGCMGSPQQPALPDTSKDDSVITGEDWEVFKLKKNWKLLHEILALEAFFSAGKSHY